MCEETRCFLRGMESQCASVERYRIEDGTHGEGECCEKHDFALWKENSMENNYPVYQVAEIHHVEVPSFHVEFVDSVNDETACQEDVIEGVIFRILGYKGCRYDYIEEIEAKFDAINLSNEIADFELLAESRSL